ncbi:MAG TPA: O-antigen ligase family protein [Jatrophihabitans sp.]|uniref:O-antigen ligase family protein n=1 Tax=Jatrophihabitans sp. TaxID=1932789 RepID=UPI002F0592C6
MSVPTPARWVISPQWGAPLLLAALSVSLVAQGAFYPRAQLWVAALLGAALLALPGLHRLARADRPVTLALAGLAGWAVIGAALHHDPRAAVPYLALLIGILAVFIACRGLDAGARDLVLTGLVGCGVLIALLGWLGLALHWQRWTWQGQGLWRASSTLTYPNATAIILAMLALITLACLTETPRSTRLALGTTVLLTGLIATLSRAGLMAVAVGLLVLAAARGPRALLRAGWGPVLGAVVAAFGLVPTMTASSPRPVLAGMALAAGLAISVGATALRPSRHSPFSRYSLVAVGGLALLALGFRLPGWSGVTAVTGARLTVDDPERAASFHAALEVFQQHWLIGAGPSLPSLTWAPGTGSKVYRYAHNEYLQVLAELGIVGGVLLATLLVTLLRRLYQRRRTGGAVSAGALAATAALAFHAGFDFVWHIPAIPLLAAALVGLASPEAPAGRITQSAGETSRKEFR